jgi:hypothetical protein
MSAGRDDLSANPETIHLAMKSASRTLGRITPTNAAGSRYPGVEARSEFLDTGRLGTDPIVAFLQSFPWGAPSVCAADARI